MTFLSQAKHKKVKRWIRSNVLCARWSLYSTLQVNIVPSTSCQPQTTKNKTETVGKRERRWRVRERGCAPWESFELHTSQLYSRSLVSFSNTSNTQDNCVLKAIGPNDTTTDQSIPDVYFFFFFVEEYHLRCRRTWCFAMQRTQFLITPNSLKVMFVHATSDSTD